MPWLERIRPLVVEFELSAFSEEYVVFELGERSPEWFERHREWIAGLVRLESGPLSEEEVARGDAAEPFVHAHRPRDARLGGRVHRRQRLRRHAPGDRVRQRPAARIPPHRRPARRPPGGRLPADPARRSVGGGASRGGRHSDAVRSVRELEIEATSLFERADNALKLIGDQYLSRVYDLAQDRFHLPRVAAVDPPQARDGGRRLRPARPAGGRDEDGGARVRRDRADRAGDRPGDRPALSGRTISSNLSTAHARFREDG